MKIVTQLNPTVTDGAVVEPRGILNVAHVEPKPGIHVKVMLGSAGVVLRRGNAAAVIPHDVLIAALGPLCPGLIDAAPTPPAVIAAAHKPPQN